MISLEAPSGRYGTVEMEHRNSEGEKTTIERITSGEFEGQALLCVYDNYTPTVAMTLLDDGLVSAIREWIER